MYYPDFTIRPYKSKITSTILRKIIHGINPEKFFIQFLKKQTTQRKYALIAISIVAIMYPGQNNYQRTIVKKHYENICYDPKLKNIGTIPIKNHPIKKPSLTAKAAIVQDVRSGAILYMKNPDMKLYPASTTKIMTALVSLDFYKDLSKVLTIHDEYMAIGHKMGLKKNEQISVKGLLYGLLVSSGNDAAITLANNYKTGYSGFILEMNKKAKEIGLNNTHYENPSGIENYKHLTTAHDLSILATYVVNNQIIYKIMQTKKITVYDITGSIKHNLINTNKLLGYMDIRGLKTGWTLNAGECLVTYTTHNNNPIVIVVLHSNDRFGDTKRLIEWTYSNYKWEKMNL